MRETLITAKLTAIMVVEQLPFREWAGREQYLPASDAITVHENSGSAESAAPRSPAWHASRQMRRRPWRLLRRGWRGGRNCRRSGRKLTGANTIKVENAGKADVTNGVSQNNSREVDNC